MNWTKHSREDLKIIPKMQKRGFTIEFAYKDIIANRTTPENPPRWPVSFIRGHLYILKLKFGWASCSFLYGETISYRTSKDINDHVPGRPIHKYKVN